MAERKYQYRAKDPVYLTEDDFMDHGDTRVCWLTGAGVLINCRGTILMVDPALWYTNSTPPISEMMEELITLPPIRPEQVPKLDAVLYTHADFDHLSKKSAKMLWPLGAQYYGSEFICGVLRYHGIPAGQRHATHLGQSFQVGPVTVTPTPVLHDWQRLQPEEYDWVYGPDDYSGFLLDTPDGRIWIPGDSQLLPEHLTYGDLDLAFIDFSDNEMHFGREGAIRLFNHYPNTPMIMYHYGTYYAPDADWFNADPNDVLADLDDPNRLLLLAPGELYILKRS